MRYVTLSSPLKIATELLYRQCAAIWCVYSRRLHRVVALGVRDVDTGAFLQQPGDTFRVVAADC